MKKLSKSERKKRRLDALKRREQEEKLLKTHLEYPGHSFPVTRRELLSAGLLTLGVSTSLPSFSSLLRKAAAEEGVDCGGETNDQWPVFINLHLAGGPALFANHLIGGEGGRNFNNDNGYGKLGMGPGPESREFFKNKAPFWVRAPQSKGSFLLRGLESALGGARSTLWNSQDNTGEIQQKTVFVAASAHSEDDKRGVNREEGDILGLLRAAGATGGSLPYLLVGRELGYKHMLFETPQLLKIAGESSVMDAIQPPMEASLAANANFTRGLFELIKNLSKVQMKSLLNDVTSQKSKEFLQKAAVCATDKNSKIISNTTSTSLGIDTAIWGTDTRSLEHRMGTAVTACLRGFSSSASILVGGYDYHRGRSRVQADNLDIKIGEYIGKILRDAHTRGKKLFLFVTEDGSVSSEKSDTADDTVQWIGDYGVRGVNYVFAYDPEGEVSSQSYRRGVKSYDKSWQLNHFSKNDEGDYHVNLSNPLSDIKVSNSAVLLNYLNFAGKLEDTLKNENFKPLLELLNGALPSHAKSLQDFYIRILNKA